MPDCCRWWVACSLAVGVCVIGAHGAALQSVVVADALNLYERGAYQTFFEVVDADRALDRLFPTFEKEANRWIAAADETPRERRTFVAASAALEIAHRLRDEPPDRAGQYLVWASLLMRRHPPLTPATTERLWYLACLAGMTELDDPWVLVTGRDNLGMPIDQLAAKLGRGGQLAAALRRFPDEPRLQLALVASSARPVERSVVVPAFLEFARRHSADRVRAEPQSMDEWVVAENRNQAVRALSEVARVAVLKQAYEALGIHESLRAEIALRIGYLESIALNRASALEYLRQVPQLSSDSYLRYMSEYFIGRTLQDMGDRAGALDAFERATRIVPSARSAATHLAAELLLTDRASDRDRAYTLLLDAYSDLAPLDPWDFYGRGDARLWPVYMAQLRRALR